MANTTKSAQEQLAERELEKIRREAYKNTLNQVKDQAGREEKERQHIIDLATHSDRRNKQ